MEGLGPRYMTRKKAGDARCAEAAKPKLTFSVLDHNDSCEPTELTPYRVDRWQGNLDCRKASVQCGIQAIRGESNGFSGRLNPAAHPQAPISLARLTDSPKSHGRNGLRRLSIGEQCIAELVEQQLLHGSGS